MTLDAIVVGAGPNGLVAANLLADAGWTVLVLEANDEPGGAVRSEPLAHPDFSSDVFSAFYPMTAASRVIADLALDQFGLDWTHAPKVLAHPREGRPAVVLSRDLDETVASIERSAPGDGERYRQLFERWCRVSGPLMDSLLQPFPPVRHSVRLLRAAGLAGTADLARLSLLTVRRMMEEEFDNEAAGLLFAGNALHADLTPDSPGSALFGWMLSSLGQQYGFPVPVGGARAITDALVRRAEDRGVEVQCGRLVTQIALSSGRAVGVIAADGTHLRSRTVLADCDASALMLDMVGPDHLPGRTISRIRRFQRAAGTFKVDWALSSPVPWTDPEVHGAGTVHIADSLDELTMMATQLATSQIPAAPFLLVGQMTTSDATRSPPGTESLWAYTHVPQDASGDAGDEGITGAWTSADTEAFAARMERRIERHAPGFTSCVVGRHVMGPGDMQRRNRNLVGGDISGGTAQLHQQLVFRPITGRARPETPIKGLFLASASAHPGGAVHGACGANAARAALLHRPLRRLTAAVRRTAVMPSVRRVGRSS